VARAEDVNIAVRAPSPKPYACVADECAPGGSYEYSLPTCLHGRKEMVAPRLSEKFDSTPEFSTLETVCTPRPGRSHHTSSPASWSGSSPGAQSQLATPSGARLVNHLNGALRRRPGGEPGGMPAVAPSDHQDQLVRAGDYGDPEVVMLPMCQAATNGVLGQVWSFRSNCRGDWSPKAECQSCAWS
jgi:hypothetical protein